MNLPLHFFACTAWLAALAAQAQQPMSFPVAPPELLTGELTALADTRLLIGADDTIAFAAGELGRERLVKGAPYCADSLQESVQALADGNRIVRRLAGARLCRDAEGRTRQEVDRGGHKLVYLHDPLARESWVLHPQRKTARQLGSGIEGHEHFGGPPPEMAGWREYAEKMREWARGERTRLQGGATTPSTPPPVPPVPPAPPVPAIAPLPPAPVVLSHEGHAAPGAHPGHDQKVLVLRMEGVDATLPRLPGLPAMATPPLPPGVAWRAQLGAPRGPGAASSLGSKDLEGVRVNGERTTWTIEAGKIGNEKPIVITRDVWTSPDLMLTVMTRDADPRVGETTYKLANLKRGEPDASLMRVPADYAATRAAPPRKPPSAPAKR